MSLLSNSFTLLSVHLYLNLYCCAFSASLLNICKNPNCDFVDFYSNHDTSLTFNLYDLMHVTGLRMNPSQRKCNNEDEKVIL